MNRIADSELILNPDGSVYHLNLKPENIAHTIIFVGDQNRVPKITKYFDSIEFETQKREFRTITGVYKGNRMSVISTGIGPDNIDIVINELDALVNIDLETRTIKKEHTQLNIVRIGTSGSLQKDIPVDSFVLAKYGLGFDGMLLSYDCDHVLEADFENAFIKHTNWSDRKSRPYIVKNSSALEKKLLSDDSFLKNYKKSEITVLPKIKTTLTIEEIHQLYDYKFENQAKENVKLLFIFACLTGFRWIDIENFDKSFIKKTRSLTPILIPN